MVSPQSANEMVKTVEARGWIELKPDPSHGRIIRISLTAAGDADEERARLHAQLRAAVRAVSLEGI